MTEYSLVDQVLVVLIRSDAADFIAIGNACDLFDIPHLHREQYLLVLQCLGVIVFIDVLNKV